MRSLSLACLLLLGCTESVPADTDAGAGLDAGPGATDAGPEDTDAGVDAESTAKVVEVDSDAQLRALQAGLLGGAALALLALLVTKNLPSTVPKHDEPEPSAAAGAGAAGP